jgi:outer membrane protein OmpA-like peptidoglycan-associated protein
MKTAKLLTLAALTVTGLGIQNAQAWDTTNGQYRYGPSQMGMNNIHGNNAYRNRGNGGFSFGMGFSGGSNITSGRPVHLPGVGFKYDSAKLTPESGMMLDRVASRLRTMPELEVEVGGHASAEGDDNYNLDLSRRRAESVRSYLIEHGVKAESISATGYGEKRPIVENATEQGRSVNRRVELVRLQTAMNEQYKPGK